jgi:hypothetical protein
MAGLITAKCKLYSNTYDEYYRLLGSALRSDYNATTIDHVLSCFPAPAVIGIYLGVFLMSKNVSVPSKLNWVVELHNGNSACSIGQVSEYIASCQQLTSLRHSLALTYASGARFSRAKCSHLLWQPQHPLASHQILLKTYAHVEAHMNSCEPWRYLNYRVFLLIFQSLR